MPHAAPVLPLPTPSDAPARPRRPRASVPGSLRHAAEGIAWQIEAREDSRPWKSASQERAGEYWVTKTRDADGDSLDDLVELRRRSRDSQRNNPLAASALHCKVTSVVGTGLKLNAAIDSERLGLSDDQARAWEAQAEAEWALFSQSTNCDLARTLTFAEQQELAFRAVLENGDHFVTFATLPAPRADWPYGFALQHIEADRVCDPSPARPGLSVTAGVEKEPGGAPLRYWVARFHPGAVNRLGQTQSWSTLPAFGGRTGRRLTLHLFRQLRTGQTRGVPDLAPVLGVLKQLDRYIDAEVDRAVKSALFLAFVTTSDGEGLAAMAPTEYTSDRRDYYAEKKIDLDHSTITSLFPGDRIEFSDPKAPNAAAESFLATFTRLVGAALELPHEVLTRHFQSSYSAARGALLMAWQFFHGRRQWLAQALCQPVYEAVITDAILAGRLAAPGFLSDPFARAAWLGSDWVGDAPPILDEQKAIAAAQGRLELGLSTRRAETAALTGRDYDQVRRQRLKEAALEREIAAAGPAAAPTPARATRPGEEPEDDGDNDREDDPEDMREDDGTDRPRATLSAATTRPRAAADPLPATGKRVPAPDHVEAALAMVSPEQP